MQGAIALILRYLLLLLGSSLVTAGILTARAETQFCIDVQEVANAAAVGLTMALGGTASVATGIGWRFWAKKRGGLT